MSKNNNADLDVNSDTDSDDQDYVPEGEGEVSLDESNDGSNNESDEENFNTSNKRKHESSDDEKETEVKEEIKAKHQERTNDLWSKFLSDVKPNEQSKAQFVSEKKVEEKNTNPVELVPDYKKNNFFNGTNTVVASKIETLSPKAEPADTKKPIAIKSSGLSSILDKISKKPKINTLEKSRQDWMQFKQVERIEDELASHSKGKTSYLERKAFLERTDLRQFEIEKELRDKERKLRDFKK